MLGILSLVVEKGVLLTGEIIMAFIKSEKINFHFPNYDKQENVLIPKTILIMLLDAHLQTIYSAVSNSNHLLSEYDELAVHKELGVTVSNLRDNLLNSCHPMSNEH